MLPFAPAAIVTVTGLLVKFAVKATTPASASAALIAYVVLDEVVARVLSYVPVQFTNS